MADVNKKSKFNDEVFWLDNCKVNLAWWDRGVIVKNLNKIIKEVVENILDPWMQSLRDEKNKLITQDINNYSLLVRRVIKNLNESIKVDDEEIIKEINTLLKEFELIIDWYLLNLVWKSDIYIRFCKWKDEIFANRSLKNANNESYQVNQMYDENMMNNINNALARILEGNIVWYKKLFKSKDWVNILWTTVRLPNTEYNVRVWFPLKNPWDFDNSKVKFWQYLKDISIFSKTEELDKFEFKIDDFQFTKKAYRFMDDFTSYKKYIDLNDSRRKDLELLTNYLYLASFTLDYIFKFNPSPAAIYRWDDFPFLSESYFKISGYSLKELKNYYNSIPTDTQNDAILTTRKDINKQPRKEFTSLIYKEDNYKKVIDFTNKNKSWYENEFFTLTHKKWIDIELPWSNFIYQQSWWPKCSLRTWNLGKMNIIRDKDKKVDKN